MLTDDKAGVTPLQQTVSLIRSEGSRSLTAPRAVRLVESASLQLARWPSSEPLPQSTDFDKEAAAPGGAWVSRLLFPAALEVAKTRAEMLRSGRGAASQPQQDLAAAFAQRLRDACGGAVAPAYAPLARQRFVDRGGLRLAWAAERQLHRFPVERAALGARVALQVASDAHAAAAERCVALLREVHGAATKAGRRPRLPPAAGKAQKKGGKKKQPPPPPPRQPATQADKQSYAAVRAVGRWGAIRAALAAAEQELLAAEAALGAAVEEAEAQQERLEVACAGLLLA